MGRAYEVRKVKMEKSSAAKTKVYSKYGRELYVAAKQGSNPEINSELQRIIEKAKKDQVPNDIIERAIKKATSNDTENYENVIYEGFGPGGSNLIIRTLTDNHNRTYSDIRACFNKTHAKLGVSGSVMHQFTNCALFEIKGVTEEDVFEKLLEEGIEPKEISFEDGIVEVQAEISDFNNIKQSLKKLNNVEIITEEITYLPITATKLSEEDFQVFEKLYNMLDELDDIQEVYHNVVK